MLDNLIMDNEDECRCDKRERSKVFRSNEIHLKGYSQS